MERLESRGRSEGKATYRSYLVLSFTLPQTVATLRYASPACAAPSHNSFLGRRRIIRTTLDSPCNGFGESPLHVQLPSAASNPDSRQPPTKPRPTSRVSTPIFVELLRTPSLQPRNFILLPTIAVERAAHGRVSSQHILSPLLSPRNKHIPLCSTVLPGSYNATEIDVYHHPHTLGSPLSRIRQSSPWPIAVPTGLEVT